LPFTNTKRPGDELALVGPEQIVDLSQHFIRDRLVDEAVVRARAAKDPVQRSVGELHAYSSVGKADGKPAGGRDV
jgi:hypothetical protein